MNRLAAIEQGSIAREKILLALAGYKFLTPSHLLQLGIASDVSYIRKKAKERIDRPKPFVQAKRFVSDPTRGGRENFYFLTKHGKNVLLNNFRLEQGDILYLKGGL